MTEEESMDSLAGLTFQQKTEVILACMSTEENELRDAYHVFPFKLYKLPEDDWRKTIRQFDKETIVVENWTKDKKDRTIPYSSEVHTSLMCHVPGLLHQAITDKHPICNIMLEAVKKLFDDQDHCPNAGTKPFTMQEFDRLGGGRDSSRWKGIFAVLWGIKGLAHFIPSLELLQQNNALAFFHSYLARNRVMEIQYALLDATTGLFRLEKMNSEVISNKIYEHYYDSMDHCEVLDVWVPNYQKLIFQKQSNYIIIATIEAFLKFFNIPPVFESLSKLDLADKITKLCKGIPPRPERFSSICYLQLLRTRLIVPETGDLFPKSLRTFHKKNIPPNAKCGNCSKQGPSLKTCGGCKMTQFCSKECQIAAWKGHKSFCQLEQKIIHPISESM
eukprot:TRINITY_DN1748_c0_g1_i10.p1 TRINITY_DN1748_c0_g1~~TRINITY_DN1748_c0_g1_i10.p1  ORF type:complete len:406 (-),score=66.60 TRINITY_DN1748_c0_g1_i10:212-1378(-)